MSTSRINDSLHPQQSENSQDAQSIASGCTVFINGIEYPAFLGNPVITLDGGTPSADEWKFYFKMIGKPNGPQTGWDIPSLKIIHEMIRAYKEKQNQTTMPSKQLQDSDSGCTVFINGKEYPAILGNLVLSLDDEMPPSADEWKLYFKIIGKPNGVQTGFIPSLKIIHETISQYKEKQNQTTIQSNQLQDSKDLSLEFRPSNLKM